MSISLRQRGVAFVAIVSLVGCSRDPAEVLIAQLQSADVEARRTATRELVEKPLNDARIIGALMKSTTDADVDVRHAAIDALGKLGPSASTAVPALKAALQDQELIIRNRAAIAIARIDPHDRSFVQVLIAEMRSGDGRTLLDVGSLGPSAVWAAPTFTELLAHTSPKVRVLAAQGLGAIGPGANRSLAALQQAAKDPEAMVRRAAQQAIGQISSSEQPADGNNH